MKYCPTCETEYLDSAQRCADCGEALVSERSQAENRGPEGEPGLLLCEVTGPVEAEQLVAFLVEEGIEARVRSNVETVHIGFAEDHAGWGEIWVPRSKLFRARQLLQAYLASCPEESPEEL